MSGGVTRTKVRFSLGWM